MQDPVDAVKMYEIMALGAAISMWCRHARFSFARVLASKRLPMAGAVILEFSKSNLRI